MAQQRLESFFHEMECNRMTSFMEFMIYELFSTLSPKRIEEQEFSKKCKGTTKKLGENRNWWK